MLLDDLPAESSTLASIADSSAWAQGIIPLFGAALNPQFSLALTMWRIDPQWADRISDGKVKATLPDLIAGVLDLLREDRNALHSFVDVVLRDGDQASAERLRDELGVDGWAALDDDRRRALLEKVPAEAADRVRAAPDETPRATAPSDEAAQPHAAQAHAAEDWERLVAADLSRMSPSHRTAALSLARWRIADITPDSVRMQQLSESWNALTADERVDLVLAHPFVLAAVAAAARVCGGPEAARAAVGETVARADVTRRARRVPATLLPLPKNAGFLPGDVEELDDDFLVRRYRRR